MGVGEAMRKSLLLLWLASSLLWASIASAGLSLEGNTDSLELVTSAAGSIDYDVAWSNVTATALTTPGTTKGNIASATTTTILAAPSASNWRYVRTATFHNASTTVSNALTLQVDVSATNRLVAKFTLAPGEYAVLDEFGKVNAYTAGGLLKTQATDVSGYGGRAFSVLKVGTASEAAGIGYAPFKDSGTPGAWAPGTPGLNGTATECDQAAEAALVGAPLLPDPATGSLYLTQVGLASSVANLTKLIDVIWYNSGLVVGTLTAQAITQPTLDARDANGSTNGDGWQVALYNGGVIGTGAACTTGTMSYTDSDGNAGNTAKMASWPATAEDGTFIPFQLAAGDRGVRSIQSITLACAHTSETLYVIHYRELASIPNPIANVGGISGVGALNFGPPGVRVYNNSCIVPMYIGSTTTLTTTTGSYTIMER